MWLRKKEVKDEEVVMKIGAVVTCKKSALVAHSCENAVCKRK